MSTQSNLLPQILVIEADADLRESLCTLLGMEGFQPLPAANHDEALVRLATGPLPLVILMDGDLPLPSTAAFMDAWAAGRAQRVPVLALADDRGQARREPLSRATSFLVKPVRLEALLGTLRRVLGRSKALELRRLPETLELPL